MKKHLLSIMFFLIILRIQSQEVQNNEGGLWFTAINKFNFFEKFSLQSLLQWRFVEQKNETRIFLVAPLLNYKINNSLVTGLGYNYSNYSIAGIHPPSFDYENRLWQHLTLFTKFRKLKMNQRFMFEERFKRTFNNEDIYSNRFRYRMNFDFNIVKLKKDKYLLGRFSEEFRIRFSKGLSNPNFDQNNFIVSLGYQLFNNSKLYLGYRHDYYNSGNDIYWDDHILNIIYSYNFDFTI